MFKISYNMSSNILGDIFDQRTSSNHLLKNNDFVSRQVHCVYQGTEWLSVLGPNMWDLQPLEIKQSESFDMYEAKINRYTPSECPCTLFWTYIQDSLFEDSFKIKNFKNHFYCYCCYHTKPSQLICIVTQELLPEETLEKITV